MSRKYIKIEFFFRYPGGKMLYAYYVALSKDIAYSLKPPPLLKQQGHIQEKQRAMNQRPWMIQCCLWGKREVPLFHTPSTGLRQFPPPIQPKEKEWGHGKKGDPHQEQEKVNKEKTREKLNKTN